MENVVAGLRTELAERGVELTPEDLNDVLQALAFVAGKLGGYVDAASGGDWFIWVEHDPDEPESFFAGVDDVPAGGA